MPFVSRTTDVRKATAMNGSLQPIGLSLVEGSRLRIDWSDGQSREYSFRELRDACPCATCREKRNAPPEAESSGQKMMSLPVLSAAEARPLVIEDMKPVGNYAYSIAFSDGHNTGIYTLEHLRELGREVGSDSQ
jgi:DUF971 family protein